MSAGPCRNSGQLGCWWVFDDEELPDELDDEDEDDPDEEDDESDDDE